MLSVQSLAQRCCQVADHQHLPGQGRRCLLPHLQEQLVPGHLDVDGDAEHPLRDVGQPVPAGPRRVEVRGQRGVHPDAGEPPAHGHECERRALRVVQVLRDVRVCQPVDQSRAHVGVAGVEVGHLASAVEHCRSRELAGAPPPRAGDGDCGPFARGPQPGGRLVTAEYSHLGFRCSWGLLLLHARAPGPHLVETLAQRAELQGVEQTIDVGGVPRLQFRGIEVDRDRNIVDEAGQPPVHQHLRQGGAQRITRLPRNLVDPVHQAGEGAVLANPLRGRLLPHPRDARQVVAGVPSQRRVVGVLARAEAVLLLDGGRGHPRQLADALLGIEHRDPVVDELEGVAVAGDDRDVPVLLTGAMGQSRDDVVRLEAVALKDRDPERLEHLLDQGDLALELIR